MIERIIYVVERRLNDKDEWRATTSAYNQPIDALRELKIMREGFSADNRQYRIAMYSRKPERVQQLELPYE